MIGGKAIRVTPVTLFTWLLTTLSLMFFGVAATAAAMEAAPAPFSWSPQLVMVAKWGAHYQWAASSTATVDHYAVLGTSTGGTGRWILDLGSDIHWTGTGFDDGPAIQAAATSLSQYGGRLVLHGTVVVNTTITITPTGAPVCIHMGPSCIISANVPGAAIFYANSSQNVSNPPGGAATLASPVVAGAMSFTTNVPTGLQTGDCISLVTSTLDHVEPHLVRSVSGTLVNICEPITVPAPATTTTVYKIPGFAVFKLTGDPGSLISGSAMEVVEMFGARWSTIDGITTSVALTGTYPWHMYADWGTRNCRFSNIHIIVQASPYTGTTGFGLEGARDCAFYNVTFDQSRGILGAPFVSTNGAGLTFFGCSAPGSNIFMLLEVPANGSGHYDTYGHQGVTVLNCDASDSTYGVIVRDGGVAGAGAVSIINLLAPRCSYAAVMVDAPETGSYPNSVNVIGGNFTGCGGAGGDGVHGAITVFGGQQHSFTGFDASGSVAAMVWNGGTGVAANFNADNCTSAYGAVIVSNAQTVTLSDFTARGATQYGLYVVANTPTQQRVLIRGADLTGSGTAASSGSAYFYGGWISMTNSITGWWTDHAVTSNGITIGSNAEVWLRGITIQLPPTPSGALVGLTVNSGTTIVHYADVHLQRGGTAGAGGAAVYGAIVDVCSGFFSHGGNDFSLANTPLILVSGTPANFGPTSFTLSGSAATVINVANQGVAPTFTNDKAVSLTPFSGTALAAPYVSSARSGSGSSSTFSVNGLAQTLTWSAAA